MHRVRQTHPAPLAPPQSGDGARLVAWLSLRQSSLPRSEGAQELLVANARLAGLSPQDQGLAFEIMMGCLRNRRFLDLVSDGIEGFQGKDIRENLRDAVRMGLYQIFFMDRVPSHALVHATVEVARLRLGPRDAAFCNALLRGALVRFPGREAELPALLAPLSPADRFSFPGWIVRMIKRQLGDDRLGEALAALNQALPLYARATPKIASAVEAARFLLTGGIPARARPDLGPLCLEVEAPASVLVDTQIFRSGGITIQDASAQWVSAFAGSVIEGLDAPVVVDYCAAPGGKTTHLAGIMAGRGRLVACDVSAARLGRLQENVARLGYQDFVEIATLEPEARKVRREPDPSPNADLVLVDAPCSGLGTLRRHPEIRWRLPHAELGRLAALQGEILERAARLVRPGGALVYATCSLAEEENEAVVQAFLSKRGENFEPILETESLPEPLRGRVGADGWLRSMPPADETDGARAIRLRRKDQGPAHG